jgi:hypothetical protein
MKSNSSIQLSRILMYGFAALILWMTILTAIFNFVTGAIFPAVIWLIVGLGVIIILLQGSIIRRLEGQVLPRVNLLFIVAILVLVGLNEIYGLVVSPPSLGFAYLHNLVFVIGYFVILGFIFYQMRLNMKSNL